MTEGPSLDGWWSRRTCAAASFSVGAVIMAVEMVASRLLTPVFGSSIYTWASLIAVVMVGLSAGYLAGGRVADRYARPGVIGGVVCLAGLTLVVVAAYGARALPAIFRLHSDMRVGALVGSVLLTLVPVVLLAMYAPFVIRLNVGSVGRSGSTAGVFYGLSTAGSVFGTLFTAFVLVPRMPSGQIMTWLAVVCLLTGVALVMIPKPAPREVRVAAGVVLVSGVVWAASAAPGSGATPAARAAAPSQVAGADAGVPSDAPPGALVDADAPDGVLARRESPYSSIHVVKDGPYVCLRFARIARFYNESRVNLHDPTELAIPYTRLMTAGLAYPDTLRKALVVGLGGGATSLYLRAHVPELEITAVELDPVVVELAHDYFGLEEGPGMEVAVQDGRVFLDNSKERFDLIFLDPYRGGWLPFHLLTREFFELVRSRLAEGGCVVANLHSTSRLVDSALKTLGAVFGPVHTYSMEGCRNVIAVACAGEEPGREEVQARAGARQQRYGFAYHLASLLELRGDFEIDPAAEVLGDDFAPVNYLAAVARHNELRAPGEGGAFGRSRAVEARPLRGIRIDGDLSDWPAGLAEHPVLTNARAYGATDIDGDDLLASTDLSPRFMVGYDPEDDLLYVALRVRDDDLVADGEDPWSNDACEVYVSARLDGEGFTGDPRSARAEDLPVQQYVAVPGPGCYSREDGNPCLSRGQIERTRTRAAYGRAGDVTTYEWAIEVFDAYPGRAARLAPGGVLGLDVVVVDRDRDEGPPSWICWGPAEVRKYAKPQALGRVALAGAE